MTLTDKNGEILEFVGREKTRVRGKVNVDKPTGEYKDG